MRVNSTAINSIIIASIKIDHHHIPCVLKAHHHHLDHHDNPHCYKLIPIQATAAAQRIGRLFGLVRYNDDEDDDDGSDDSDDDNVDNDVDDVNDDDDGVDDDDDDDVDDDDDDDSGGELQNIGQLFPAAQTVHHRFFPFSWIKFSYIGA